jgi:type IV pilus biogenesis protein CpaD/CtpE
MKRFVLLAGLAVAACTDPHQPLSADFGNAVNTNIAAQVVNPTPAMAGSNDTDGQRAGSAVNRYRTNRVYQPHLPLEAGKIYGGADAAIVPAPAQ